MLRRRIAFVYYLLRYFGPKWLFGRLFYIIRLRLGICRYQIPSCDWESKPLTDFIHDESLYDSLRYFEYRRASCHRFFFNISDRTTYQSLLVKWDKNNVSPIQVSDRIEHGEFEYFGHKAVSVGFPPNWHKNVFTGQLVSGNVHWSQIGDFEYGDIKIIWEPNRFGFVYTLVRAYWRTGNERYAEMFWELVEDWRKNNPPNKGVNWKCGQEISFRIMAWCFGLYGFLDAKATTPERVVFLTQMIAVSGERIEKNIAYALSQQNNHGMSESLGLWTIGLLFPEFSSAQRWSSKGKQILERLAVELIYEDGSFSQHSLNYHRLMLHVYLWSMRLGDIYNVPLSKKVKERIQHATEFLYQLQDSETGQVPNYGQNDGALVLPLSNCGYSDYRPILQSLSFYFDEKKRFDDGPWNEDLLWLFGLEAINSQISKQERTDLAAIHGGYYTLRTDAGFLFTRCASYKHRPGQADMLHVDIWWRGLNIVKDAGTYSYNSPGVWDNPYAHTYYHNTVSVDGHNQMDRMSKFMRFPWAKGNVTRNQTSTNGYLTYWEGEHDGYKRLKYPVKHRRGILRIGSEHWLVCDFLGSKGDHEYRLHWLLSDFPYSFDPEKECLIVKTAKGNYRLLFLSSVRCLELSLVRADEICPKGWYSPCYNLRMPALSLEYTVKSDFVLFCSVFGPDPLQVSINGHNGQICTHDWELDFEMKEIEVIESSPLVASTYLFGTLQDRMEIH